MRAYAKDILRTLRHEKKRLLALMTISALGVTMMTGLKAACDDLRYTADRLFDAQKLHDLSVVSTIGLRKGDIEALRMLPSVEQAEGAFSKSVQLECGRSFTEALVKTFDPDGLDIPYVIEGRLPERADETAVTKAYLTESGKRLGDQVRIQEQTEDADTAAEESSGLRYGEYTITGVVIDVTAIVNPEGATSFRNTGPEDHTAFVTWDAVDSDYYTEVVLTVAGAEGLSCFSPEYERRITEAKREIEVLVKGERQIIGYEELYDQAEGSLNDAEASAYGAFADAQAELEGSDQRLSDGRKELDAARQALLDGQAEVAQGRIDYERGKADAAAQLALAKSQLAAERQKLLSGLAELDAAGAQLDAQEAELDRQEAELLAGKEQLEQGRQQLEAGKAELQAAIDTALAPIVAAETAANAAIAAMTMFPSESELARAQLEAAQASLAELQAQRAVAEQQFSAQRAMIDAQEAQLRTSEAQLRMGMESVAAGRAQIREARQTLAASYTQAQQGAAELDEAERQLLESEKAGQAQLLQALQELQSGIAALESGKQELSAGEWTLKSGETVYQSGVFDFTGQKASTEQMLLAAREFLGELPDCVWYVRDRSALGGFADVRSDADCIESIGTVFPVLFLIVAVLISLTTINRMVEENRGLIGTFQALGFRDREIRRKFTLYSSVASLLGGLLGNLLGYIVLPEIIFVIFRTMYLFPAYRLTYNALYGLGGVALFYAAIVGATLLSCNVTVQKMPAVLMRPKAPQAGSRILLERITPIWKRLSFLNKVTARNLFRYKKRFLMTVFGIAGCTGLLLCGLSLKDTVADLIPRQYEQIISYDMMAVTAGGKDFDTLKDTLADRRSKIRSLQELAVTNVDVHNEAGDTMAVQLYIVPEGAALRDYFSLMSVDGEPIKIRSDGFYITENIRTFLGYQVGDRMLIQDMALNEAQAPVRGILEYYLGNSIFVTEALYEALLDDYSPNAVVLCLKNRADEAQMTDELKGLDEVLSVTSVQELKDGFEQSFLLMNMVVYVVIVLAGALAFAVLFTLAATNISERDRELATIKVLGFYDGEVHTYVNKETLLLTLIGMLAGLPLGVYFGKLLGDALVLPSIIFRTVIHPVSYAIACGITVTFALIVELMTNRIIDRVDPIEALKCVE